MEKISEKLTDWIGRPISILVHTILFIGIFGLRFWGYSLENILLILTTALSLEAIYLAIFIQMTVNKTTKSLEEVEKDIDDIQEDVDDIQEDVEDLGTDVKEISDDYIEEDEEDDQIVLAIKDIEKRLEKLHKDVLAIKSGEKEN
ncbi:DUF948 domain-containing protein [Patescibacteria group bacterium]|nr:DUF948 domain-containing protein [Patescibacteria group bacterium]